MLQLKDHIKSFSKLLDKPLLVFDLETTGLDTSKDEVVEFCGLKINPDTTHDSLYFKCKPTIEISESATSVHNISNDDVKDEAPFVEYIDDIKKFFENADIAGFNLKRFDVKLLERQLSDNGVKDFFKDKLIYDAYSVFCKHSSRNLTSAVKYYLNESIEDAHSAHGDVLATACVIAAQLEIENANIKDIVNKFEHTDQSDVLDRFFLKKDGEYVVNFSKHKGKLLKDVDKGFIKWILNKEFPRQVHECVKAYL